MLKHYWGHSFFKEKKIKNNYENSLKIEESMLEKSGYCPDRLCSENSKTGWSFRSLLSFCTESTSVCRKYCYACYGRIAMKHTIALACAVRKFIQKCGPKKSAERMVYEVPYGIIFRWMDRGDFDWLYVDFANHFIRLRPDLKHGVISRNMNMLLAIDSRAVRTISLDAESVNRISVPVGIRKAYLRTSAEDVPPKDVDTVFVLNERKNIPVHEKDCNFRNGYNCIGCRRCYTHGDGDRDYLS